MKKVFWTLCYDGKRVRTGEINNNTGLTILKIKNLEEDKIQSTLFLIVW